MLIMDTTKHFPLLLATLVLCTSIVQGKSTAFQVNKDLSCSGGAVSLVDLSIVCQDGNSNLCELGDKMEASGTMEISQDLSDQVDLKFKACFLGMFCTKYYYEDSFDICNELQLTSTDGSTECPSAGTYSFKADLDIPGESMYLASGWSATVYTTVSDSEQGSTLFSCTNSIKARQSASLSWSGATVGISAVSLVIGFYLRSRRRRSPVLKLESTVQETAGEFELMSDKGVHV